MILAGGGRSPMSPGGSAAGRWAGGAETERGGRAAGDRDAEEREGGQNPPPAPTPRLGRNPPAPEELALTWKKSVPLNAA